MSSIHWGKAGRFGFVGLSAEDVQVVARRWCGDIDTSSVDGHAGLLRLVVPEMPGEPAESERGRIRIGIRGGDGQAPLEMQVGPHFVAVGVGGAPDIVRFSQARAPSRLEFELLIDLGVNHLLARQGLPVLHSCAFDSAGGRCLGSGRAFRARRRCRWRP